MGAWKRFRTLDIIIHQQVPCWTCRTYKRECINYSTFCTQSRDVILFQMEYRSIYKRERMGAYVPIKLFSGVGWSDGVYSLPFILWEWWFAVKAHSSHQFFFCNVLHCSHDPVSDLGCRKIGDLAIGKLGSMTFGALNSPLLDVFWRCFGTHYGRCSAMWFNVVESVLLSLK